MTLEENIRELRDGLTVTSAQTLLHERRLKDHQQWMEDMDRAFARMAALYRIHSEKMVEFDVSSQYCAEIMGIPRMPPVLDLSRVAE
jgi:hypothetical protein